MVIRLAFLALLPSLALAKDPPMSTPSTVPTETTVEATAGSKALAGAIAAPVTTVSPDIEGTVAPVITANPSASGAGDSSSTLTDESRYDAWALALSLPTATAGIPGAHICHETSRGWSATLVGRSGGTTLKEDCYEQEDCKDMVRLYIALRQPALAVKQMEKCGGIVDAQIVLPEKSASAGSSSHAEKVEAQKAQVRSGK